MMDHTERDVENSMAIAEIHVWSLNASALRSCLTGVVAGGGRKMPDARLTGTEAPNQISPRKASSSSHLRQSEWPSG